MTLPDWAPASADETAVWQGKPRARIVHWGVVTGVLVAVTVLGVGGFLWRSGAIGLALLAACAAVALVGFAMPAGSAYLWRTHTDYLLTDAALYHRTGAVWVTVTELGLEKVQNSAYSQGVFGTMFDHGTVTVDTAGSEGAELSLRALDDPDDVHRLVAERAGVTGSDESIPGTIEQWRAVLDEVRKLRTVLRTE
ncbi:PH domain-containing protein [Halomicrobium zhouii]|uniref:PH domain-containing protein n=1 Tax=Halomicrobium zhouii TaxID=767519 RepID=A0A1I6LGV7_9EURY|nr:PH domain-containing protein [Halomicrobium zhouii]SFS02765.1 PH domain-containing protein [Halomicrobium zhouii]